MAQSTYVVTGVSNGIGRALGGLLKAQGHRVIGLDIAAPEDPHDQFVPLDLSDPLSIQQAADALPDGIDGLCNSAGLPPRSGLEWMILSVNFFGSHAFTKALYPKLKDGGAVVNLASRAGHRWRDNLAEVKALGKLDWGELETFIATYEIDPVRAYDLSKEANILWTMAASETYLKDGKRINSISPGAVETGIMQDFAIAFGDRMARNVERAGRAGTAEEVAYLAAFLLSPQSSWIKGTDISIDGGMSAFSVSDALGLDDFVS